MPLINASARPVHRRHTTARSIGPVAGIGAAPTCRPWWSARLRTPTAAPPCTRAQHRARRRRRRRTEMPALVEGSKSSLFKRGCAAAARPMLLVLVSERRLQRRHAPARSIGRVTGGGAAPKCRRYRTQQKRPFQKGLCSGCTAYAAREGCKCRCIGATQQARSSDLNPVVAPHRSASAGSPLAARWQPAFFRCGCAPHLGPIIHTQ
jgi:hypothetical protein